MIKVNIRIPRRVDLSRLDGLIEKALQDEGLTVTARSSLAKYPGRTHWHAKKESERGTLEITFWKRARRLWFSVQERRKAEWVEKSLQRLAATLRKEISNLN